MWPLRLMWLYEVFPSPLRSPTNLLLCGLQDHGGLSLRTWMCACAFINECASLCACMTVSLLRMYLRSCLRFKPDHRTHWTVSQFGCEWVWVIRFACPVCWWLHCCLRRSAAPYLGSSLISVPADVPTTKPSLIWVWETEKAELECSDI